MPKRAKKGTIRYLPYQSEHDVVAITGHWPDISGYHDRTHRFWLAYGGLGYTADKVALVAVNIVQTILWLSVSSLLSYRLHYFQWVSYLSTGSPAICQARVDKGSPRVAASEKLSDTGTLFARHKLHHSLIHSCKEHQYHCISHIGDTGQLNSYLRTVNYSRTLSCKTFVLHNKRSHRDLCYRSTISLVDPS